MARMTGFIFQDEYLERLAKLSDQEVGRLIRALSMYHASGKEQELAGREGVAFDFIKVDIDRIDQKYEARCETNSNNRQRSSTNDNDRQQSSTNDNESEGTATKRTKDKDNNKDKDNDNKEKDKEKAAQARRDRVKETLAMFNRFWDVYPRKTAKQNAVKAFGKLNVNEELLNTMLTAIEKQKSSPQWSDPQYIPHPATWLNGHRWEDEVQQSAKNGKIAQTNYTQRSYEETKPGELPDWYIKMLEDEQRAEAAKKAGVNPVMPQWLAEEMLEEAMKE